MVVSINYNCYVHKRFWKLLISWERSANWKAYTAQIGVKSEGNVAGSGK